ncbi:hypothetical protein PCC6912_39730 [Chlorogloeopsis fritschii PCC 6912]|uniref:Uncharacterized protein n=1 Tax=Chlorogloeopsis fritschii PCC 6912 TaxID=211165 RepID=A0A433N6A4_CHLFR|nr:hypothetical protein [Chlorogloeopsis fritschii]RUR77014.1 hypothetical protein PCC6912_39730 [Chlorogloeopsis fritschii PCC 6912]
MNQEQEIKLNKIQQLASEAYKLDCIRKEIYMQSDLITCKFNVKPNYVLLGVEIAEFLKQLDDNWIFNEPYSITRLEGICKKLFDLTPIVDYSIPLKLPKDYIQVVIPQEVLG